MLDVFNGDAFSLAELTAAINNIPYKPQRLGEMGLFDTKGVTQRTIIIEEKDGVLQLLPTQPWGAPGSLNKKQDRRARPFLIPHIPQNDTVLAAEVQGIRAFGSQTEAEGVAQIVTEKIASMRNSHEVTLEHLRAGAIKGVVKDADDDNILYNLYTEYGVYKQADQDWDMHVAATEQAPKIMAAIRLIETALGGVPYSYICCLMGNDVWDKFIANTSVKTAYERWVGATGAGGFLREDMRKGFYFGGMWFENYRGQVGSTKFIDDDEGRVFPVGSPGLFQTIYAPADYIETVNTIGLPFYAKQQAMEFDKGVKIETQSNPLCICTRPKTLIRIYGAA